MGADRIVINRDTCASLAYAINNRYECSCYYGEDPLTSFIAENVERLLAPLFLSDSEIEESQLAQQVAREEVEKEERLAQEELKKEYEEIALKRERLLNIILKDKEGISSKDKAASLLEEEMADLEARLNLGEDNGF